MGICLGRLSNIFRSIYANIRKSSHSFNSKHILSVIANNQFQELWKLFELLFAMASFAHFHLFPSITYARTLCEFHILYVYYMLLCPIWGSQMCSTINQNHLILVSCAKCSGNEHVRRKHFWPSTSNTLKIPSYSKQYFISYCIRLNRERKKKMYAPFGILEKKFETLINLKQCQLMNDVGWCIMSGGNMHAIDECKRWTSASVSINTSIKFRDKHHTLFELCAFPAYMHVKISLLAV